MKFTYIKYAYIQYINPYLHTCIHCIVFFFGYGTSIYYSFYISIVGLEHGTGLYVSQVVTDSQAYKHGLRVSIHNAYSFISNTSYKNTHILVLSRWPCTFTEAVFLRLPFFRPIFTILLSPAYFL